MPHDDEHEPFGCAIFRTLTAGFKGSATMESL
jgi:hypothetical protein